MICFVYDANSVARTYIDDIGTANLTQLYNYPDSLIMMPEIAPIETTSAWLSLCDEGFISNDQYQVVQTLLKDDINRGKFKLVDFELRHISVARQLLERYRPIPGVRRKLKGADSVYLATAVLLADSMKPAGARVILVSSDIALYQSALSEPNLEAFHFWTCQCPKCGQIDIPTKMKEHQCPNPTCAFACFPCCLANCESVYVVRF
jgi:hypothetical protein